MYKILTASLYSFLGSLAHLQFSFHTRLHNYLMDKLNYQKSQKFQKNLETVDETISYLQRSNILHFTNA